MARYDKVAHRRAKKVLRVTDAQGASLILMLILCRKIRRKKRSLKSAWTSG